ncbi:MAG: hypothetical protein QM765_44085 [Myxococcales bacterium]
MRLALGIFAFVASLPLALAGCKPPRPPDALPTPDEIAPGFVAYTATPLGRKPLEFKVLVPREWKEQPLQLDAATLIFDDAHFVPLARFAAPSASGEKTAAPAFLEVSYLRLYREVDLGDFVDVYLREQDVQVLSSTPARFNDEPVVDVVATEGGRRVRLAFRKAGPLVFLVAGSAAQAEYPRHASAIGASLVSFAHLAEPKEELAEKVRPYDLGPGSGLKIRKPDSWLAAPVTGAPEGCGGVDVTLKEDQAVRAIVRLRWADKLKAKPEVADGLSEATWREFLVAGVHDVDFLGNGRMPGSSKSSSNGTVGLWRGTVGGHQVLMRAATYESPRAVYAVTLLGPSREESPELWAAGARFFAMVTRDVADKAEFE